MAPCCDFKTNLSLKITFKCTSVRRFSSVNTELNRVADLCSSFRPIMQHTTSLTYSAVPLALFSPFFTLKSGSHLFLPEFFPLRLSPSPLHIPTHPGYLCRLITLSPSVFSSSISSLVDFPHFSFPTACEKTL